MTTTLAQRVVAGLKDKILAGDLAPGSKLPSEAELIEEYAVSRTVVREAVTRLRAEGLVETQQGRGSFVSDTVDLGKSLRNQMLDEHLAAAADIGRELGFTPEELEVRLRALTTREQDEP